MSDNKKFYWLKLQKDFFKRHDIRIVEGMVNGKDYILFYLKLLVESVTHYGHLRFSETIPYTDEMLSIITNTNVDIVRSAIKLFSELKMIQILDDKTIFMAEVEKMVGDETVWAAKKRQYRLGHCPTNVPALSDKSLDIDIELDKDKRNIKEVCRFTPPTLGEVKTYCTERKNKVDAERFIDFYTSKGWMIGKSSMKDWKASVRTWEKEKPKFAQDIPQKKNFEQRTYDDNFFKELGG